MSSAQKRAEFRSGLMLHAGRGRYLDVIGRRFIPVGTVLRTSTLSEHARTDHTAATVGIVLCEIQQRSVICSSRGAVRVDVK